jgi:hypothetical protein
VQPFLQHPAIDNIQTIHTTTIPSTEYQSKNLASLLSLCTSGDALASFIKNSKFNYRGIEMFHHLRKMKYPSTEATTTSLMNVMYETKIQPKESLEQFAHRLRSQYITCTANGISLDERYLVRCFIRGLDTNYDYTRDLLLNDALSWYSNDLNDVVQLAKDVKLTRESSREWITVKGFVKIIGKQGPKCPENNDTSFVTTDNDSMPTEDSYLWKKSNLNYREVHKILQKFSFVLCRRNGHPLHKCRHILNVYNITFKSDTPAPAPAPTSAQQSNLQQSTGSAGHVSMLPIVLEDNSSYYNGLTMLKTSQMQKQQNLN